jgi:hypothetical protein
MSTRGHQTVWCPSTISNDNLCFWCNIFINYFYFYYYNTQVIASIRERCRPHSLTRSFGFDDVSRLTDRRLKFNNIGFEFSICHHQRSPILAMNIINHLAYIYNMIYDVFTSYHFITACAPPRIVTFLETECTKACLVYINTVIPLVPCQNGNGGGRLRK